MRLSVAPTGARNPVSARTRVGIVDADGALVKVLVNRLAAIGWASQVVPPASAAPEDFADHRLTAVVVDLRLVDGGIAWLDALVRLHPALAVVVCSAAGSVAERVQALRLGADDWIAKPAHPEEVVARLEAALRARRAGAAAPAEERVTAGEVEIRPDMYDAFVGGQPLALTRREFELLALLAAAGGAVMPRETIYEHVWGYAMAHGDRSVDVFVRRVRQKLERHSPGWRYLHTHVGVGYRFAAEPAS